MAEYRYDQRGVSDDLELGKGGGRVIWNTDHFEATSDGSTLVPIRVGAPSNANDAASKTYVDSNQKFYMEVAASDETTDITDGVAKITFRMPAAVTLNAGDAGVRASLNTVSSSGIPTIDINEGGVSILSTLLTIDVSEKTSLDAAVPVVISDVTLADDAEITIDIDIAGTGAKGLKVALIGVYT